MIPEERKLCCNQTTLPPHQSSPFSSSRKHGPYTHNPPKPLERWSFSFSSAQWHGCSVSEKEVSQVSPWRVNQDKGTHVCPGNWKSMGGMTCLGSCRVIDSSLLGEKKRRLDRLINWVSEFEINRSQEWEFWDPERDIGTQKKVLILRN